jgi:hypothetical protein
VCVIDGRAAAAGVRLARASDGRSLELRLEAPDLTRSSFTLIRDGAPVAQRTPAARGGEAVIPFGCGEGARCPPGDYRVEATWGGKPWIFTNPIRIE